MDGNRYPGMNPNQPTSAITTVTINLAHANHAVTTIHQFRLHAIIHVRYILSFFSKEKDVASLTLRVYNHRPRYYGSFYIPVHHYTLAVFLCWSIHDTNSFHVLVHHSTTPTVFLCPFPFPFHLLVLIISEILGRNHTGAPNPKSISVLWQI